MEIVQEFMIIGQGIVNFEELKRELNSEGDF